ncbi:hypothetical protein KL86DES1_20058 [uncultured Desulfovibrio sp.]|uniref:Uncharacterized protein n=1 Tax=uncultured Desulfovibrio sp. TaxID=167968 RepID=A0A212L240_9BACT|nr:hypothetical protein KL86DES1_20058 [uncultured Desulfovibrio sp.]VZH32960.1 conserved protein of unknown function [Desulfovibrio sp. 86]
MRAPARAQKNRTATAAADIDNPRFYRQCLVRKNSVLPAALAPRLEQCNFYIALMAPWRLREQTFATEAWARLICAGKRRSKRALNFENAYSQR